MGARCGSVVVVPFGVKVEASQPGRWDVRIVDGDWRALLTFGWADREHVAQRGLGLLGAHVEAVDSDGEPRRLNAGFFRDLPWARWERAGRRALDVHLDEAEVRHDESPLMRVLDAHPELGEATPQAERRRRAHMRLVLVSDQYRRNLLLGLPDPVKAIATEWEVAPATARSWLHRARREGYLEPVTTKEEVR